MDRTIIKADKDHDGKISFDEFTDMVKDLDVIDKLTINCWNQIKVEKNSKIESIPRNLKLNNDWIMIFNNCVEENVIRTEYLYNLHSYSNIIIVERRHCLDSFDWF